MTKERSRVMKAAARVMLEDMRIPEKKKRLLLKNQELLEVIARAGRLRVEKGPLSEEYRTQARVVDEIFGAYLKMPELPLYVLDRLGKIKKEKGALPKDIKKAWDGVQKAHRFKRPKEFEIALQHLESLLESQ